MLRLLFVGDVYGKPGRRVLGTHLPTIRDAYDFIIVNGENAAGGFGLNRESAQAIFKAGAGCITLGNHTWNNKEVHMLFEDGRVIRPLNYPPGAPGAGFTTFTVGGERLTVVNLLGRVYMDPNVDNPFSVMEELLARPDLGTVFVDFHAEATSEKIAFARHFDGRVAAVIGTHTHVATADTRVLPGGTAFQADAGMTGPYESIIGADPEGPIARFLTGLPHRYVVAEGPAQLNAVAIDLEGGRATRIERVTHLEH